MRTNMRGCATETETGWKGKTIAGVLIDPEKRLAAVRTIPKSLEGYYKALDCTTIDITRRYIGGRLFEIVVDDEGALRTNPVVSAVDHEMRPMLYGRLFITQYDGGEDLKDLTEAEAEHILRHTLLYIRGSGSAGLAVECEYHP